MQGTTRAERLRHMDEFLPDDMLDRMRAWADKHPEEVEAWLTELRGNREQCRNRLCDVVGDDPYKDVAYCCLGVYYDLFGSKWKPYTETDASGDKVIMYWRDHRDVEGMLSPKIMPDAVQTVFVSFNDGANASFKDIANWVSSRLVQKHAPVGASWWDPRG